MKECNLDCALQHEGYCTREDIVCTAKTDSDLMTEKEYDERKVNRNETSSKQ